MLFGRFLLAACPLARETGRRRGEEGEQGEERREQEEGEKEKEKEREKQETDAQDEDWRRLRDWPRVSLIKKRRGEIYLVKKRSRSRSPGQVNA